MPEQLDGKLGSDPDSQRLARSLLEDNSEPVQQGNILNDAVNYNINSFVADLMFEQVVNNYKMAEKLYGPKLLREISGYSNEQLQRDSKVPEFQRELERAIGSKIKSMKKEGLLENDGTISDKGMVLASLVLCTEELDKFTPKGIIGDHEHRFELNPNGVAHDVHPYKTGDKYSDLAVHATVRTALRRQHKSIKREDLRMHTKVKKGTITTIYAIDCSGSMRGKKIEMCKKAGVALAHRATTQRNAVGLLVFSSQIKQEVRPTKEFFSILRSISEVQAGKETNMSIMIDRAVEMFRGCKGTKHLIILSDGAPTVGNDPQKLTLQAVGRARACGVTTSMVGVQLLKDDEAFARKLTDIGDGKLYIVNNLDNLDVIVLQDYESYR